MRVSRWILLLAILTQAFARAPYDPNQGNEEKSNPNAENITKEYTLEELLADSNVTDSEAVMVNEKEESSTASEVDSETDKPTAFEHNLHVQNATGRNGKILGGTDVSSTTQALYNYMVIVQGTGASGTTATYCGGALLSVSWVLTAAHCVASGGTATVYPGLIAVPSPYPTGTGAVPFIHPSFRFNYMINNIALLRLLTPLTIGSSIGTIRLSTINPASGLDNVVVTTLGFGPKDSSAALTAADTLKTVDMVNMKKSTCLSQTIDVYVSYPGETGCLNTNAGAKGVCFGDGGGPVIYASESDSTAKIIGVNSQYLGCPSQYPSSYTYVYPYLNWIKTVTKRTFT